MRAHREERDNETALEQEFTATGASHRKVAISKKHCNR